MQTTQVNELINSPADLLVAAAVIGGIGFVLFVLANLIMKATTLTRAPDSPATTGI
ncbi:MAG: hypothetical protein NUV74_04600 [Candidatus Brocadiaceae bacterium]|nr:hypothetical protein [Candidatus Brocadiaceae bacterium]